MWALIGSYSDGENPGGVTVFRVDPGAPSLLQEGRADRSIEAGYIVYSPRTRTIYCVDELKTDGRGPVGRRAGIHAFGFDPTTGALAWQGEFAAPGAFPTYLDLHPSGRHLLSASHGSFEHVEHVVPLPDGGWSVEYHYDHSTLVLYRLEAGGGIADIADLHVLEGHGKDPNAAPQAGGHAQSSAHAHCAMVDPTGQFVIVCDKGTDSVLVYRLEDRLRLVSRYQFPPETAPRHVAFDRDGRRLFMTLELASEVASLSFDPATGQLALIQRVAATAPGLERVNEPAELRLHPDGKFLFVNNRGEDSLAWFAVAADGGLCRAGHVRMAPSLHPGLAARSFAFDPTGRTLLFADRPANLIRLFAIDPATGTPLQIAEANVSAPVFVAFVNAG